MCRRVVCRTCAKASYAGCGLHVEQVLAGVPRKDRCSCGPAERNTGFSLRRLFGRG
ncbi:hypothetical protein ABT095_03960 [Kitasatospora sp. NPDC002227]|uniref:hypothetical protein n=1 Tax=Kitasatospora sp. NPDC002227 TaxID=3154773 RepID=UPI0033263EE9